MPEPQMISRADAYLIIGRLLEGHPDLNGAIESLVDMGFDDVTRVAAAITIVGLSHSDLAIEMGKALALRGIRVETGQVDVRGGMH